MPVDYPTAPEAWSPEVAAVTMTPLAAWTASDPHGVRYFLSQADLTAFLARLGEQEVTVWDLDRDTGQWSPRADPHAPVLRPTEVLVSKTAYGDVLLIMSPDTATALETLVDRLASPVAMTRDPSAFGLTRDEAAPLADAAAALIGALARFRAGEL